MIEDGPMTSGRKIAIWITVFVGMILIVALILKRFHPYKRIRLAVIGSVIKQDADTRKQSPIADVEISAPPELAAGIAKSDFTGYFRIILPSDIDPGKRVMLHFRHRDYLQ